MDKLADIRSKLREKDQSKHKMIFVADNLDKFQLQEGLGDIKQYKMSYTSA